MVEHGRLLAVDEDDLVARARDVYARLKERIVERFWPGRTKAHIFPQALPNW